MSQVIVDASLSLAWCFPDEVSDYADQVLASLEGKTILVPAVWIFEVANAVLVGERRKRLNQTEITQFTILLESLSLVHDNQLAMNQMNDILFLARAHGLTAYDAAYLELSIRHNAPLATLDDQLQKAARSAGVKLFSGKG